GAALLQAENLLAEDEALRQSLDLAQVDADTARSVVGQLDRALQLVEIEELEQFRQIDALVECFELRLEFGVLELVVDLEILGQRIQIAHPLRDDGLDTVGEGISAEQRLDEAVDGERAEELAVESAASFKRHGGTSREGAMAGFV